MSYQPSLSQPVTRDSVMSCFGSVWSEMIIGLQILTYLIRLVLVYLVACVAQW